MYQINRGPIVPALLAIALLCVTAVSSCSGSSAALNDAGGGLGAAPPAAPALSAAPLAGLPALPSPAGIGRDASVIESGLVLAGASFRDDLTHQNVSVVGDSALFDPAFLSGENPMYSQVALAIYSFDVSAVSDEVLSAVDLDIDGLPDLLIGTARVFAGIPNLSLEMWEWSELEKSSGAGQVSSWSWGASNPGSLRARAPQGVLNVCVVVFGDTALDVSRVALSSPPDSPGLVLQELFHKSNWDLATNKGNRSSSISLDCDDQDRVHATCYDSSNGQLYYFQVEGRVARQMAADCDSVCGTSNSVCVAPDGSLLLAYTDDNLHQGVYKTMAPDVFSSLSWSPRSTFDNGDDGTGVIDEVGSECRIFIHENGDIDVFSVDTTSHRIRRSSLTFGTVIWTTEFVSPPGEEASSPVPIRCADGSCVAYLSRGAGGGGGGGLARLALAIKTGGVWSSVVLADDVQNPTDDDCDGFCDGAAKPGTDEVVVAYSSPNGFSLVHYDLSSSSVRLRESPSRPSSSGAYVRCAVMSDGSVRVAHYDTVSRTIFFENGDVPTGEDFVSLPAVHYGEDTDEDCDAIDFWVDPDSDGDGLHQAVLVELSSSISPLGQGKKDFKGHVTLLK